MLKIKPSKLTHLSSFGLVGLGFASMDFGSAIIYRQYFVNQEQKNLADSLMIDYPLQYNFMRNFCYGLLAANTNQIFLIKINEFIRTTNRSHLNKLFFSPIKIFTYYAFAAAFDRRSIQDILLQFQDDIIILGPLRIFVDFLAYKGFFLPKNQASSKELSFKPSKWLLFGFVCTKFLNTGLLINFYEKRNQI